MLTEGQDSDGLRGVRWARTTIHVHGLPLGLDYHLLGDQNVEAREGSVRGKCERNRNIEQTTFGSNQ